MLPATDTDTETRRLLTGAAHGEMMCPGKQNIVVGKILCACSAQGKSCAVTADSSGSPPEGRQELGLCLSTQAQTKGTLKETHRAPSLVQDKTTSGSPCPATTELAKRRKERINRSMCLPNSTPGTRTGTARNYSKQAVQPTSSTYWYMMALTACMFVASIISVTACPFRIFTTPLNTCLLL